MCIETQDKFGPNDCPQFVHGHMSNSFIIPKVAAFQKGWKREKKKFFSDVIMTMINNYAKKFN